VLRLFDIQARELADIAPSHGRQLRLYILGPSADRGLHFGDLRPYLVSDLIRRSAQRYRLTVVSCQDDPGSPGDAGTATEPQTVRHSDAFRADCLAMNIHPPDYTAPAADGVDVIIETDGAEAIPAPPAPHRLRSAPVIFENGTAPPLGATIVAGLRRRGIDPLAVRLALLERPYREQATLSWPHLTAADQELRTLRGRMARWATHPSKPMSAQYVADISGAFDDDLNAPAALTALRKLADDGEIPDGSKFETVAHADQWLGLDLASEVGRVG
jgi:cysteinyl-tRNA synthetase